MNDSADDNVIKLLPANDFIGSIDDICPVCKSKNSLIPLNYNPDTIENTINDKAVVCLPYRCKRCSIEVEMVYEIIGYRIPRLNKNVII